MWTLLLNFDRTPQSLVKQVCDAHGKRGHTHPQLTVAVASCIARKMHTHALSSQIHFFLISLNIPETLSYFTTQEEVMQHTLDYGTRL